MGEEGAPRAIIATIPGAGEGGLACEGGGANAEEEGALRPGKERGAAAGPLGCCEGGTAPPAWTGTPRGGPGCCPPLLPPPGPIIIIPPPEEAAAETGPPRTG